MFLQMPDIGEYIPFIIAAALLGGGVLLLKLSLTITRAKDKTDMKWVAGSFFIQYGTSFFISVPIILDKIIKVMSGVRYKGPTAPLVVVIITVSIFILINFTNMLHKPGVIRSIIIISFIVGPMIGSTYLIFSNIMTTP
ncbi:MAG: hypothetical protein Lokiarch_17080 [Candidatus Lokiarchaeum sp. GC14_75]|nr:MAG: hypothetical protein Lokiarch_17080 [Candidatus Lokiarchaeum sp. GC14_75]HDZ18479.1 hypothetical protein [archaeon]